MLIELKSRETLTNTPGGIVQSVFDILVSKAKEQGCIRSILQLTAVSIIVIMRYALRNQDKIRNALGEDLLLRLLESLKQGFNGEKFDDIVSYLLTNSPIADPYMCMADFSAYVDIHNKADMAYRDRKLWNTMSINNIAGAGYFSADRSIREYADNIWHLKQVR